MNLSLSNISWSLGHRSRLKSIIICIFLMDLQKMSNWAANCLLGDLFEIKIWLVLKKIHNYKSWLFFLYQVWTVLSSLNFFPTLEILMHFHFRSAKDLQTMNEGWEYLFTLGLFTWSWDNSLPQGNSLTPESTLPWCMVWRL